MTRELRAIIASTSSTSTSSPSRRPLGFELALVVLVSAAVLVPGIWRYTLVDPWETHYGEVSRRMLQDHDWVHTQWQNEGFRSKPVLMFWLEAASLSAFRVATDGGYSGELEDAGGRTMLAIRLPFVLSAIGGLVLMWWMLARLVNRRLAWLALLVVGSCPFYCMIARQAIPDMLLVATMTGAIAMFAMAVEDGDRPIEPLASFWIPGLRRLGRISIDARHVLWAIAGGIVVVQALYYAYYFSMAPVLASHIRFPGVNVILPAAMLLVLAAMSRTGWLILRMPFLLIGARIRRFRRLPPIPRGTSRLDVWDRDAPDRYLVRALVFPIVWIRADGWDATAPIADRLLAVSPITSMRQVFILWCYALLGISVLAKGPPAFGVVGIIGVFYVVLLNRWRPLYDGAFEIKRGLLLAFVICFPWHFAMYLKDGLGFIDEYIGQHLLNRAGDGGVDKSFGTFEHYILQLGYGLWLWAALLPAALTALFLRARTDTREGRIRMIVALWAIITTAFFSIIQTKFHHYILPAVPAFGIIVAFFLDDMLAGRARLHPLLAAIGVGVVLLICRDLVHAPGRWIDMFMYAYNRPWPAAEPWKIDPSTGFWALGVMAAVSVALLGTRFVRLGVAFAGVTALAICVWALQAYLPVASRHWGMREAMRSYYAQRTIYGETLVYFGNREVADAWADAGDHWRFETFIPDNLQVGQPMTLHIEVHKADDDRITESTHDLRATVTAIGAHDVELQLAPGERKQLDPLIAAGKNGVRGRPPLETVDADHLIAWQLYWRGENFWSGDEIWGWLAEQQTVFKKDDSSDLLKYLNDRSKAPLGRRYFVITLADHAGSLKSLLPTQRAKDTFSVIETTSNKFSMDSFWL